MSACMSGWTLSVCLSVWLLVCLSVCLPCCVWGLLRSSYLKLDCRFTWSHQGGAADRLQTGTRRIQVSLKHLCRFEAVKVEQLDVCLLALSGKSKAFRYDGTAMPISPPPLSVLISLSFMVISIHTIVISISIAIAIITIVLPLLPSTLPLLP